LQGSVATDLMEVVTYVLFWLPTQSIKE